MKLNKEGRGPSGKWQVDGREPSARSIFNFVLSQACL